MIAARWAHSMMIAATIAAFSMGIEQPPHPMTPLVERADGREAESVTFASAFSAQECAQIVASATALKGGAGMGGSGESLDAAVRVSNVYWLPLTDVAYAWVAERVLQHVQRANREWRFALPPTGAIANAQVAEYAAVAAESAGQGGHYHWHVDADDGAMARPTGRVLSVTVQLTPPADYDGGALQLAWRNATAAQGSLTVFPAWLPHRVHPVTSGVRRSIVVWIKVGSSG